MGITTLLAASLMFNIANYVMALGTKTIYSIRTIAISIAT